jgi:solute:Na+ symporter, SSS family
MVKPETEYTAQEKQMTDNYFEYVELQSQYQGGSLDPSMQLRYETLKDLSEKDQLRSYVSYVKPLTFYALYGIIVGVYVILGGFGAAVVTDAIQAVLIIVFSFILIPFGLAKLGGFSGLHANVPDYMFRLFGSMAVSEYTWYSFLAILFVSMVQIHAMAGNMAIAGSAKNELAARMGAVTGGFGKRFMIICWSLCGLIAVGLLGESLSNPENAWGALTKELLGPGAIGFMLAGILAANMSSLDAFSVNLSALFVRNLYAPIYKNKTDKHYIVVGRLAIAFFLIAGIFIAMRVQGIVSLLKYMLVMNVTFGAPIYLLFVWRRVTKKAVVLQVIITFIVIILLPFVGTFVPAFNENQSLTLQTREKVIMIDTMAREDDVEAGLADEAGELIKKQHVIEPVGCFFETVIRIDPSDPDSKLKGKGLFYPEVYFLHLIGVDVRDFTPPMLLTARFVFDGAFPFVLLFAFSWLTKHRDKEIVDKFYAKMKTKVLDDPDEDERELQKSFADPHRNDHLKLFPRSNWQFLKWDKEDTVGFVLSCVAVVVILGIFLVVLNIGS